MAVVTLSATFDAMLISRHHVADEPSSRCLDKATPHDKLGCGGSGAKPCQPNPTSPKSNSKTRCERCSACFALPTYHCCNPLQPFVPEVKKLNDKAEREERKKARNESRKCIKVLLSIAFRSRATAGERASGRSCGGCLRVNLMSRIVSVSD